MRYYDNLMLFAGNSNLFLAKDISDILGISLGKLIVNKFSDGEIHVEIQENVRNKDIIVIQSTSYPANDNIIELIIIVDALKRASAGKIIAAIPYFGYARQDRRPRLSRAAISAKIISNILEVSGIKKIITMDLHTDQIQGFFNIPVDNIYSTPIFLNDIKKQNHKNLIIVSPDVGGISRAKSFLKQLNCDLAIIDKRRTKINIAEIVNVIGNVNNKTCIIIDDILDTAGTVCNVSEILKNHGAKKIIVYATHPVLSGCSIKNISLSEIDEIIVTNTIPLSQNAKKCKKIRSISCANIFAETFIRAHKGSSVMSLFLDN